MGTVTAPNRPHYTDIALQTRIRHDIPNNQSHEFSAYEKRLFPALERRFNKAVFRDPPNPIYNCHGLTFASRRTGITDNEALKTILAEDGYHKVAPKDVLPGDTILYYQEDGDVEHSGIVVSKPESPLNIPWVLSKWGSFKEVVHHANDCPYEFRNVEYYRVTEWD